MADEPTTETAPEQQQTAPPSPTSMPQQRPAEPEPVAEERPSMTDAELKRARQDAARYRTERNSTREELATMQQTAAQRDEQMAALQRQIDAIAKVFNPQADEPLDPTKLAEQLEQQKTAAAAERQQLLQQHADQVRKLRVEAALPTSLTKLNADADLTRKILAADGTLDRLDPASDTFAADLEAAVAAALDQHPALKVAAQAAATRRSGPEIPGRTGGSDQLTRAQLQHMKPEQIAEAQKSGRLRNVLSGG